MPYPNCGLLSDDMFGALIACQNEHAAEMVAFEVAMRKEEKVFDLGQTSMMIKKRGRYYKKKKLLLGKHFFKGC
jgi:hypothetical protein